LGLILFSTEPVRLLCHASFSLFASYRLMIRMNKWCSRTVMRYFFLIFLKVKAGFVACWHLWFKISSSLRSSSIFPWLRLLGGLPLKSLCEALGPLLGFDLGALPGLLSEAQPASGETEAVPTKTKVDPVEELLKGVAIFT
jgi:hypothetical protein